MKRHTIKQRFQYWFDEQMSKGTSRMVLLLGLGTILFIFILSFFVIVFAPGDNIFSTLWDSFSYTINAWMPTFEDGGDDYAYLFFMALAGLIGLFITSALVGILTAGVEEKLEQLRHGASLVLEEGHTVILGFNSGIYELVRELCLSSPNKKRCIVIASSEEKTTMENLLCTNINIPENIKIICRSIDPTNISDLFCCSIPNCKSVIINERDDISSIKVLLAVKALLNEHPNPNVRVATFISHGQNLTPAYIAGNQQVTVLPVSSVMARLIAHTCTQVGISEVFNDLFNFEGSELYFSSQHWAGHTFHEYSLMIDGATPIGILRNGRTFINPSGETHLVEGDQLLLLAEEKDSATLLPEPVIPKSLPSVPPIRHDIGQILIIGSSSLLPKLIVELQENAQHILLAGISNSDTATLLSAFPDVELLSSGNMQGKQLDDILNHVDHVILLRDELLSDEDADNNIIMALLNLREIRTRMGINFNITAEMNLQKNKLLIQNNEYADYIIASDISSKMMAQISEEPRLFPVFRELLSNQGNEIYLIPVHAILRNQNALIHADIRALLSMRDALYIGYTKREQDGSLSVILNPPLTESVSLNHNDGIIIIAEDLSHFFQ